MCEWTNGAELNLAVPSSSFRFGVSCSLAGVTLVSRLACWLAGTPKPDPVGRTEMPKCNVETELGDLAMGDPSHPRTTPKYHRCPHQDGESQEGEAAQQPSKAPGSRWGVLPVILIWGWGKMQGKSRGQRSWQGRGRCLTITQQDRVAVPVVRPTGTGGANGSVTPRDQRLL